MDRGGDLGLGHVGTRVINTLSIEKGENKMMKSMYIFSKLCLLYWQGGSG